MKPICQQSEKEQTFNIKIEDIEKVLDKDFKQKGETDKAIEKLKGLLENIKGK